MIIRQPIDIPAGMQAKREALYAVYDVYSEWVERFQLACRRGCAACCTQSVTMTSLEGEEIVDFLKKKGTEELLPAKLARVQPGKNRARITMNQYAEACLNHRELEAEVPGNWDFTPCMFLEENRCSIYEVRPFGCRSFGSFVECAANRAAEMAPIHLTVNTVFTQIIEHLNIDGGNWSTMAAILHSLAGGEARGNMHLLAARPLPGFLLEPLEVAEVHALLQQLRGRLSAKGIFGDLIDNFLPI